MKYPENHLLKSNISKKTAADIFPKPYSTTTYNLKDAGIIQNKLNEIDNKNKDNYETFYSMQPNPLNTTSNIKSYDDNN